jgi:adenylate cyclase
MTDDFTAKLAHVLKVANLSRTRLSKLVGVDKSVASRWVSGATRPSDANLDALTRGLSAALPDLKLSDWARRLDDFVRRVGADAAVEAGGAAPPTAAAAPTIPTASQDLPLPDKPSIAVLPFANMSGDPDQEFFGDGIAEDILTALSKLRWLFVISRNSSFTYKGKAVDVRQVSRELGVRYVLEGSVRRAGSRARITAQLIDAVSGAHVWAERYERDLTDIFAVQDEIVEAVITAISPAIIDAERGRAVRKAPHDLGAWEAYQRGMWHASKNEFAELEIARTYFQRAIELDSNFASAYSHLAATYLTARVSYARLRDPDPLQSVEPRLRVALRLDPTDPLSLYRLGLLFYVRGDFDQALQLAERAILSSPSTGAAFSLKGIILAFGGQHDEGRKAIRTALRLGPREFGRGLWLTQLAMSYFCERNYEGALDVAQRTVQEFPSYPPPYRWLVASLGQLGRTASAEAALKTMLALGPGVEHDYIQTRHAFLPPEIYELMLEGLRKAGWKGAVIDAEAAPAIRKQKAKSP